MKLRIISVDFQKDFSSEGGRHYKDRACVGFIKNKVIRYFKENDVKVAEIISDYRLPRPSDPDDSCRAGEWGYESEIPDEIKIKPVWVKCMNSPIWTKENIGTPNKKPGVPYQDPQSFTNWLNLVVGKPESLDALVLMGLTADCCVFSTAQELSWRGYNIKVLSEAVSTYSGNEKEKEMILSNPPLTNWAKPMKWNELKRIIYHKKLTPGIVDI